MRERSREIQVAPELWSIVQMTRCELDTYLYIYEKSSSTVYRLVQ